MSAIVIIVDAVLWCANAALLVVVIAVLLGGVFLTACAVAAAGAYSDEWQRDRQRAREQELRAQYERAECTRRMQEHD